MVYLYLFLLLVLIIGSPWVFVSISERRAHPKRWRKKKKKQKRQWKKELKEDKKQKDKLDKEMDAFFEEHNIDKQSYYFFITGGTATVLFILFGLFSSNPFYFVLLIFIITAVLFLMAFPFNRF